MIILNFCDVVVTSNKSFILLVAQIIVMVPVMWFLFLFKWYLIMCHHKDGAVIQSVGTRTPLSSGESVTSSCQRVPMNCNFIFKKYSWVYSSFWRI